MTGDRIELYKRTVDILYDAYFNNTLEHGNCYACAIGNIIAANNDISFLQRNGSPVYGVFTGRGVKYWDKYNSFHINPTKLICEHKKLPYITQILVDKTGYSNDELCTIERVFEGAGKNTVGFFPSKEEIMYNGLVAVLEILKTIHKIDDTSKETEKFTKHYKTKQLCQTT